MQLDKCAVITLWRERIMRDVSLLEDVVLAATGEQVSETIRPVLTHQLERLVWDAVDLTRQELWLQKEKKSPCTRLSRGGFRVCLGVVI